MDGDVKFSMTRILFSKKHNTFFALPQASWLTLSDSDCRGTETSWFSIHPPASLSSLHQPSFLPRVTLMRAAARRLAVSVWDACLHYSSFGEQGRWTAMSSNWITEVCSGLLGRHSA
ncbi:hypothetical protein ATANTOWER_014014 [Ataeniobius toweri]|uniref:Uncharacterized protein n=1 Tax=Ataeniobius toweri TaxID=208326 RepID=A0ABU7B6K5_9TELE|nr:hypothetical protein [Ataeniobius toweri]